MSKITLEPNSSGAGTFSIVSPDSNTNRTLNLPNNDGTFVVLDNQNNLSITNNLNVNGNTNLDGSVVINDSGSNFDFRVESENNGEALLVDASEDFLVSRAHYVQIPFIRGDFFTGWQDVVDLDSFAFDNYVGVRIRALGNENSNVNVSYGEWAALKHSTGWDLIQNFRIVHGNGHGHVNLRMNGSTLQTRNDNDSNLGDFDISFDFVGFY